MTSKKINIVGLNDIIDPNYRYRMSKLDVVKQRTKTTITNLKKVSKDLDREPELIVGFFKKRFGV